MRTGVVAVGLVGARGEVGLGVDEEGEAGLVAIVGIEAIAVTEGAGLVAGSGIESLLETAEKAAAEVAAPGVAMAEMTRDRTHQPGRGVLAVETLARRAVGADLQLLLNRVGETRMMKNRKHPVGEAATSRPVGAMKVESRRLGTRLRLLSHPSGDLEVMKHLRKQAEQEETLANRGVMMTKRQ